MQFFIHYHLSKRFIYNVERSIYLTNLESRDRHNMHIYNNILQVCTKVLKCTLSKYIYEYQYLQSKKSSSVYFYYFILIYCNHIVQICYDDNTILWLQRNTAIRIICVIIYIFYSYYNKRARRYIVANGGVLQ